jgi:hypothetical protein
VSLEWRWHYSVPSLALWVLLAILVVVPRHNRNSQAWLMVIGPLAVAGVGQLWYWATGPSEVDGLFYFLTVVAAAWAGVWLLAPWLTAKHRLVRALLAFLVMALVGVVGYVGYYGFHVSGDNAGMWAVYGSIFALNLIVAMTLAGWCCRRSYHTVIFMMWLMLWMPMICVTAVVLLCVIMALATGEGRILMDVLPRGSVLALVTSLVIYAINVPAMVIARLSPLYRERFHTLFCPVEPEPSWDVPLPTASPFAAVTAPVANPPCEPDQSGGECPFAKPDEP